MRWSIFVDEEVNELNRVPEGTADCYLWTCYVNEGDSRVEVCSGGGDWLWWITDGAGTAVLTVQQYHWNITI